MTDYSCRMSGALPSGERFTTGFHIDSELDIDDVHNLFKTNADLLWTGTGSAGINGMYAATVIAQLYETFRLETATGKATDKRESPVNHPGGDPGMSLPQEVAVVVTLRTQLAGASGHGRMFFPSPSTNVLTAEARLSSSGQQTFAIGVTSMFSAMADGLAQPVLYTKGRANRIISRVDVGDVFDAMRRRRDKLVEARYTGPAIPTPL
jgi:hypothetical protein